MSSSDPLAPTSRAGRGAPAAERPAGTGRIRLVLTKASLALILMGMLIVGRRNGIWPVINWPMYARSFEAPPPVATEMRGDVLTADGHRTPFMMREFAPTGEHKEVAAVFRCSQQNSNPAIRAQCARAIDALARRSVAEQDVAAVEMWEVSWNADVRALPPLDRDRPDAQRLVGRIESRNLAEASAR